MNNLKKLIYILSFLSTQVLWAQEGAKQLRIGTYTYGTQDRVENLLSFSRLIQEKVDPDCQVFTISFPTVNQLEEAMIRREVELVFISTAGFLSYLERAQEFEILGALLDETGANTGYHSMIASSKHSGILDWEDVRAKSKELRLSMVDRKSTSGYLVPRKELEKQGLSPLEQYFAQVNFQGKHAESLASVLSGESDLAAFGSNDFHALGERKSELNLIWTSAPIPLGPVLIRQDLPQQLKLDLEDLLLGLHDRYPKTFQLIKSGWVEAKHASKFEKVSRDHFLSF